jgi:CheY-like chemotaxis protein
MRNPVRMFMSGINKRKRPQDDTVRLPSLLKAMKKLVPRSVMREVMDSSHDRRQWGVLAAAWVGVSEREFVHAAAQELRMPYQDKVPVMDLTMFGSRARSILAALRKAGSVATVNGIEITGFVAVDPSEVRGLEMYNGTQSISIAPWTEIARALDMAERLISEREANTDHAETLRRKELCSRVVGILLTEAEEHGARSLEILSSEGKSRYQFTTRDGKIAVGTVQQEALEGVLQYLSGYDGEIYNHPSIGKIVVRSLGSSRSFRLSWAADNGPELIGWERSVNEDEPQVEEEVIVEDRFDSPEVEKESPNVDGECVEEIPALVIDDNPMFCRVLERLLKREGVVVSCAEHGAKALELLTKLTAFLPKVIICDLHMPTMNGKEFVTRLREDSRLKAIPVVMLTSDEGPDVEVTAVEIGVDVLISKSKDPRVLCAHVVRLAKNARMEEAA